MPVKSTLVFKGENGQGGLKTWEQEGGTDKLWLLLQSVMKSLAEQHNKWMLEVEVKGTSEEHEERCASDFYIN